MKNKTIVQYTAVALVFIIGCSQAWAQLNSFGTGYFQNQYLFNPAMSGLDAKKGNIGAGYLKSGNVKDGPNSVYLVGDYGFNDEMGGGVNVFYDRAGLINTVKIMGTYSYHIQLGDNGQKLHFGLSLGGTQKRLNNGDVTGDLNDPSLYNFNNQYMKVEADFGVAYTDGKLNVQAAAPNMVATFRKDQPDVSNQSVFFAAASYKIAVSDDNDGVSVEPKIAFRGIKSGTSILDAGANVTFYNELFNVFGLYHTNKSVSIGAGLKIADMAQVTVLYSTQGSEFRSYSGGDYEIGLRFSFK